MKLTHGCTVYRSESNIYVLGHTRTPEGIGLAFVPWILLSEILDPEVIGKAVLLASQGAPASVAFDARVGDKALVRFLGAKTWKAFASTAQSVHVLLRDNEAKIIPYVVGEKYGFFPQHDRSVSVEPNPRQLGERVLAMLRAEELSKE